MSFGEDANAKSEFYLRDFLPPLDDFFALSSFLAAGLAAAALFSTAFTTFCSSTMKALHMGGTEGREAHGKQ